MPPADTYSTVYASMSYEGQCQIGDESLESVGQLLPDKDTLAGEPDAIVVGAVGAVGAPWFLTGRAEGTEADFMIDTGCQVTILATSVLEQICTADPRVRGRLRPCRRRLVSADLSSSMVHGELCITIVFPELYCVT